MTANPHSIDLSSFVAEHLEQAEPDLLRSMLRSFVQALMSAETDAVCGAPYGARSGERTNSRNGYRTRDFDTRAGTIEVAIPKLREGSYFPDWFLERRKRAERALVSMRQLYNIGSGSWRFTGPVIPVAAEGFPRATKIPAGWSAQPPYRIDQYQIRRPTILAQYLTYLPRIFAPAHVELLARLVDEDCPPAAVPPGSETR